MAKTLLLKAELREEVGTNTAAKVRKDGRIPGIVYGHKETPVAISLNAHDFIEGLHHGHRLMDVQVGSKKETILVKDMQYDHLGKNVIHIDMMRVNVKEKIKVQVPLEFKGTAAGAQEGGIVEPKMNSLSVECLVTDIPETIVVSVKEVNVGDNMHASDIEMPEGVTLASDPSLLVLTCHLVAAAKSTEELEEEAPAAPEVIGEVKEETPGEES